MGTSFDKQESLSHHLRQGSVTPNALDPVLAGNQSLLPATMSLLHVSGHYPILINFECRLMVVFRQDQFSNVCVCRPDESGRVLEIVRRWIGGS